MRNQAPESYQPFRNSLRKKAQGGPWRGVNRPSEYSCGYANFYGSSHPEVFDNAAPGAGKVGRQRTARADSNNRLTSFARFVQNGEN